MFFSCFMSNTNPIFHAKRKWHLIFVCPQVVAFKGAKNVYHTTSNTRTQVTNLGTMSAAGFIPSPTTHIYLHKDPQERFTGWFCLCSSPTILQRLDYYCNFFFWLRDSFIPQMQHIKKNVAAVGRWPWQPQSTNRNL